MRGSAAVKPDAGITTKTRAESTAPPIGVQPPSRCPSPVGPGRASLADGPLLVQRVNDVTVRTLDLPIQAVLAALWRPNRRAP